MHIHCEGHDPPRILPAILRDVIGWFRNGSRDEEAKARAAPNGSTTTDGDIDVLGGDSSQSPSMRSFSAGILGSGDGPFGLLDGNSLSSGRDDSARRVSRETQMNESPLQYFDSLRQIRGRNFSQPSSMRSFSGGILGSGDGPFGLLDGNYLSSGRDDSARWVSRETQMNESPLQYFDSLQQILGGNSSQPSSMRSFSGRILGSGDGPSGLLDGNFLRLGLYDFARRVSGETQVDESPFKYFPYKFK